jgi:hypothetical protein
LRHGTPAALLDFAVPGDAMLPNRGPDGAPKYAAACEVRQLEPENFSTRRPFFIAEP